MNINKLFAIINSNYLNGIEPVLPSKLPIFTKRYSNIKDANSLKWLAYSKEARRLTKLQPLYLLDNYELRGEGGYHLDHVLSIKDAYLLNLPPSVPADISNLRMIPSRDNIKKGARRVFTNLFNEHY